MEGDDCGASSLARAHVHGILPSCGHARQSFVTRSCSGRVCGMCAFECGVRVAPRDADAVVEDVGTLSHKRALEYPVQDRRGGESRDVRSAGCSHRTTHVYAHTHTQRGMETGRGCVRAPLAFSSCRASCRLRGWGQEGASPCCLTDVWCSRPCLGCTLPLRRLSLSLSGCVCCTGPRTLPPTHPHGHSSLAFLSAGSLTLTRSASLSLSWQR